MDLYALITDEPLDLTAATPLYRQLEDRIVRLIATGVLDSKTPLPTEIELAQKLDLSRATVRRCFADLVEQGRVVRRRGRGTFVAPPSAAHGGPSLNFSQRMLAAGLHPSSRTLSFRRERADEELSRKLQVATDTPLFHVERLRLADRRPMTLDDVHVLEAVCPTLAEADLAQQSLYAIIAQSTGTMPARADERFEAVSLTKQQAALFDLAAGAPAFRITRITYDASERPFEVTTTLAPGDRNSYELSSPGGLA